MSTNFNSRDAFNLLTRHFKTVAPRVMPLTLSFPQPFWGTVQQVVGAHEAFDNNQHFSSKERSQKIDAIMADPIVDGKYLFRLGFAQWRVSASGTAPQAEIGHIFFSPYESLELLKIFEDFEPGTSVGTIMDGLVGSSGRYGTSTSAGRSVTSPLGFPLTSVSFDEIDVVEELHVGDGQVFRDLLAAYQVSGGSGVSARLTSRDGANSILCVLHRDVDSGPVFSPDGWDVVVSEDSGDFSKRAHGFLTDAWFASAEAGGWVLSIGDFSA